MGADVPFVLSIDRITPDIVLENRRVYVFFSLTNYSGKDTSGVVLAYLYLGAPYFIPVESTHWAIQMGSELTSSGIVAITPPFAAKGAALVLQYREAGTIVAQKEVAIDIASRFDIGLAGFIPFQIRSNDQDTVVGSVSVIPANRLGALSVSTRPAGTVVKSGSKEMPFIDPLVIPNINVIPGIQPENTVQFSLIVLNHGNIISSDLLDALNELSDVGDAIASAWVPGDSMQLVNKHMHAFHQTLFDGCNGLLAADKILLTGRQLTDWTQNADDHLETRTYTGDPGPLFCSGKSSVYGIVISIHRQRQPLASESLYVAPEFKTVHPNDTAVFTTDRSGGGHIDPNVTWSVEGASDQYGKFGIATYPAYTAPADADWRRPVIIHAVHKDGRQGIAFLRVVPKFEPPPAARPPHLPPI